MAEGRELSLGTGVVRILAIQISIDPRFTVLLDFMTPLESDHLNILGLAYLGGLQIVSIYVFFYGTFPSLA